MGSVHGRFQPFHNGHLDYVLQAFGRADFLLVGLTQIMQPEAKPETTGRDSATSNPLTFLERSELVEAALLAADIRRDRFRITPFPIEQPHLLRQFIPQGSVCFTTPVNEWNDEKVKRLKEHGFQPELLDLSRPDNVRVTSGTEIRRLLRANDPSWARFVPAAVAEIISDRLRDQF